MATCPDGHPSTAADFCDVCGLEIAGAAGGVAVAAPPQARAEAAVNGDADQLCPRCGEPRAGARFCEGCSYDFVAAPPVLKPIAEPQAGSAPASAVSQSALSESASSESASLESTLLEPVGSPHAASRSEQAAESATVAQSVPAAEWTATVSADRDYYETVRAETADDPDAPEVVFPAYCPERVFALQGAQIRIGRRSRSQGVTPEIDLSGPPADPGISHLHALLVAQPDHTWAVVDPGSTNGTTINDDPEPIAVDTAVGLHDGDRVHVGAWTTITVSAPVP